MPSSDEVESYLLIQDCLELRKRYLFRETVAPWEKEVISDPSTPKPNPDPFSYTSEGKSDVSIILKLWKSCAAYLFLAVYQLVNFCCSITLKCGMESFMSMQIKNARVKTSP